MRTQLYGSFGYIINASINHLKVQENIFIDQENDRDMAAIITGGPYYSYKTSYGDIRLDIGYGAIVAGDSSMTIFLPSVEYRINIFSRISLMIEIGYPIANEKYLIAKVKTGVHSSMKHLFYLLYRFSLIVHPGVDKLQLNEIRRNHPELGYRLFTLS